MAILRTPREFGAFAERGGRMHVIVKPDPEVASLQLIKLAGYLEDTAKPMLAAKAIAKADMQEHFTKDTAPSGEEWVPLDPDYLAKKSKMKGLRTHPSDILTFSRKMERAAVSEGAWIVTGNGELFFNAAVLPPYWDVHQQTRKRSQTNVGVAADYRERIRSGAVPGSGGAHESFGIGRGKATPQREFIGLSKEAVAQIGGVFDLWFSEGLDITETIRITSAGTVMGVTAKGRIAGKIFPRF
jgi:hypothetical protein